MMPVTACVLSSPCFIKHAVLCGIFGHQPAACTILQNSETLLLSAHKASYTVLHPFGMQPAAASARNPMEAYCNISSS